MMRFPRDRHLKQQNEPRKGAHLPEGHPRVVSVQYNGTTEVTYSYSDGSTTVGTDRFIPNIIATGRGQSSGNSTASGGGQSIGNSTVTGGGNISDTSTTAVRGSINSGNTTHRSFGDVSFSFSHDVPAPSFRKVNNFRKAMLAKEAMENKENPYHPTNMPAAPKTGNSVVTQGPPLADSTTGQTIHKSFQRLSFNEPSLEGEEDVSDTETVAYDSEEEKEMLSKVKNPNGDLEALEALKRPTQRQPVVSAPPAQSRKVLPAAESCPLPPATLPPVPEPVPRGQSVFAALKQRDAEEQARSAKKTQPPSAPQPMPGQWTEDPEAKPKREGYGFSYSDSIFQSTFDSEMTDADTEHEAETKESMDGRNIPINGTFSFASPPQASFDDLVVLRSLGGTFNFAKPDRPRPCTSATREDTIVVQAAGNALLKYAESAEIYGNLASRLERMVQTSDQPDMAACARKLRDLIYKTMRERVETGELPALVQHEGEWANWFIQATKTGVMHVRVEGCKCRPEWEG